MPHGLDYSFALTPQKGVANLAYEKTPTDDVRMGATNFMHVNSNINLAQIEQSTRGNDQDSDPERSKKPF
jgi:hypothetical protein